MAEIYYDVDLIDPQFEVIKDESGKYRFRLRAPDGEVLFTSEAYPTKEECDDRIELVKEHAPVASIQYIT